MADSMKYVYTTIQREGEKSRWVKIGVGFVNRDDSINVYLDAFPVNGKMHVRDASQGGLKHKGRKPLTDKFKIED